MATYRGALPQLASSALVLTDSGMETDLIFNQGFELPLFSAFVLLESDTGTQALRDYFRRHVQVALDNDVGFVFEAPTWRASIDWATQLGYSESSIAEINRRAVDLLVELRDEVVDARGPMLISAAIGPRGDAYSPETVMTADEAQHYHAQQIQTLASTEADLVTALTLTYAAEAIGITRACQASDMPVVISFTVETDGRLPDGTTLAEAVQAVDHATGSGPAYYGINCAHPTHFADALDSGQKWTDRVQMIRANASRLSHAELDEAESLDDGDPDDLGREYAQLHAGFPRMHVMGGCCGTDVRHVSAIARSWPQDCEVHVVASHPGWVSGRLVIDSRSGRQR
jgi:homocysteine S-methyltransferase